MSGDRGPTRRALLLGLLAGAGALVTGCRNRRRPPGAPARSTDPDAAALAVALDAERSLLAAYDAAVPTVGGDAFPYSAIRAAHAEHVRLLSAALGSATPSASPSPAPSGTGAGSDAAALRAAEASSAARLSTEAIAASSGDTAALLASIAATHDYFGRFRIVNYSSSVGLSQ